LCKGFESLISRSAVRLREDCRRLADDRFPHAVPVGAADERLITELMEAETFLCFGPDTLAEARNRGYRLYVPQRVATSG